MNLLRYPRTAQERRYWFGDDGAPRRHARSWMALPTAWDDLFRHAQRCWKEQRRTKWRRIKSM